MSPTTDENAWNPMSEDYNDPRFNAYSEGPGADMDESLQPANLSQQPTRREHSRYKIYVRNLPKGISDRGVANLFLSVGKPVFVNLHTHGCSATVEFSKPREAELAIRDLDNQPPFQLRVSYARIRDNEPKKDLEEVNAEDNEWVFDNFPLDKRPKVERGDIIKHGEKIFLDAFPKPDLIPSILDYKNDPYYYQFIKDDFDTSVDFYQSIADFEIMGSDRVSKGRGYFFMGSEDRFVGIGKKFSSGPKVWDNEFLQINECYQCQAKTIKKCNYCRIPFCSNHCLAALSHDCLNKERLLTENGGLPEKESWDYVVPKSLKYRERKIDLGTSVIENFNSDVSGFIKLSYGCGSVYYGTVRLANNPEYSVIATLQTPKEDIDDASVGEYVLVPDDCEVGRRGVILSRSDSFFRVALVDSAEVITVEKVYPISSEVSEITTFGVQITLTEDMSDVLPKRRELLQFKVTGPPESGRCPIILKNMITRKKLADGFLSKWTPVFDLKCVKLTPESQVVMTSYISANVMYLRPDDEDSREKFSLLTNEIAHCALRTGTLEESHPIVGDMYCARYHMDGSFYRAVVKSVKKEKIKIVFIDFGNEQYSTKEDLKPLPESLKLVPCFAVKVYLKDVPKKSSAHAIYYLNEVTGTSTELYLKFYETILDGVELRSKASGIDVNNNLKNDLTPYWQKDSNYQSKTAPPIFRKHLKSLKFPDDFEKQFYVLRVDPKAFSSNGVFWVVPNLPHMICYVYGEFKDKMEEYCESFDEGFSYLPRVNELCFALYEGEWLRAVCLDHEGTKCDVFFVDHGYTSAVETNAIRKVRPEFIEAPSLAVPCVISGYERFKDKPELEKQVVDYLSKFLEVKVTDFKILNIKKGVYEILIPHIERLLSEPPKELMKLIEDSAIQI